MRGPLIRSSCWSEPGGSWYQEVLHAAEGDVVAADIPRRGPPLPKAFVSSGGWVRTRACALATRVDVLCSELSLRTATAV